MSQTIRNTAAAAITPPCTGVPQKSLLVCVSVPEDTQLLQPHHFLCYKATLDMSDLKMQHSVLLRAEMIRQIFFFLLFSPCRQSVIGIIVSSEVQNVSSLWLPCSERNAHEILSLLSL